MTKTALLWEPLKIQSSPKCKARKKFRRAAYVLYASKKFITQRSITSHLVAVFWQLSGMASSSISWNEMWIFRGSLLVILTLLLTFTGCGNSDSQQESVQGKPGVADDTSKLCSSIDEGFSLAKQCAVNNSYSEVGVTIDSNDDEVARNICADITKKMTKLTAHFAASWKLQIYSPFRSDKPLATCLLH